MGWADRRGGMAAGLVVGAALAGAVVVGMAGLSYGKYSLEEGVAGKVMAVTPWDNGSVSGLDAKLTDSSLVSFLVGAADIIPEKAFDLAPEDWRETFKILEHRLEGMDTARR